MNEKIEAPEISKENQDFLTLAVKCKLMTRDQEREVITHLIPRLEEYSDYQVHTTLLELDILSEDEVDFLKSIRTHLSTKQLDIRFGKLAVANNFTTPGVIKKALVHQADHFKKTRRHLPIGDILVMSQKMSESERTAILLTQNRIGDEFLKDAMNSLVTSRLDQMELNRRFGSIAVKNGYVTIEDINKALKIQSDETLKDGKKRFIGEILEASFDLTPKETIKILKEQKLFEKRRLSLEKALFKYNSEIKSNQMLSQLFEYRVSKDKLEAYVRTNREYTQQIHAHNLINWVQLMGIRFGIIGEDDIQRFLSDAMKGSELKIAMGESPQKGRDATIKFYFDPAADVCDTDKNLKTRTVCKKGDLIARRIPHKEGKTGTNVFGQIIASPCLETCSYRVGRGVIIRNEHEYVANIDGYPMLYQDQAIFVTPLKEDKKVINVSGNVNVDDAAAYRMNHLDICGDIAPDVTLQCRELKMSGTVKGSIESLGDVEINGGIGGADPNNDTVSGFPSIKARGSVSISKIVERSRIECGQFFRSPNADIVESRVFANHGIIAKNVYSDGRHPSVLKLGAPENERLSQLQVLIEDKISEIDQLKYSAVFKEMEQHLHHRIQVQDEYRGKQNALAFLIKIMGNLDLEDIEDLGPGFDFLEISEKSSKNGEASYGIPQKTRAYEYLQLVQDKIDKDPPEVQIKVVKRLAEENYGMYKAAVEATERIEKQILIKKGLMNKEVEDNRQKIAHAQTELDDMILEKDHHKFQEMMNACRTTPVIRIKNQVSQGTVIQGKESKLVVDQTIYGVKFFEKPDPVSKSSKIVVSGYYE